MSTPDADSPEGNTSNSVVTECDLPAAPEKVWKALTAPALVSPSTTRSIAASISAGGAISSQISRPSGLSQSSRRS